MASPTPPFRYERKFLAETLSAAQVRTIVKRHPALFWQPYPPRYVNNIYLDSAALEHYYDNIDGAEARQKVRVRWYGALFGEIAHPVLEFKLKRGLVGAKESYPLPAFALEPGFSGRQLTATLQAVPLPETVKVRLQGLSPVLLNRYYRWYFATFDAHFRVTIDTQMTFHHVDRLRSNFLYRDNHNHSVVVELKYDRVHDRAAARIAGYFPFPITKNSKYIQGIESVFL